MALEGAGGEAEKGRSRVSKRDGASGAYGGARHAQRRGRVAGGLLVLVKEGQVRVADDNLGAERGRRRLREAQQRRVRAELAQRAGQRQHAHELGRGRGGGGGHSGGCEAQE